LLGALKKKERFAFYFCWWCSIIYSNHHISNTSTSFKKWDKQIHFIMIERKQYFYLNSKVSGALTFTQTITFSNTLTTIQNFSCNSVHFVIIPASGKLPFNIYIYLYIIEGTASARRTQKEVKVCFFLLMVEHHLLKNETRKFTLSW